MRLTGLLLLAFLPLTATRSGADSCAAWNPLSTRCPLAEDPAEAVSLALEKDVSGQHLASRSIHKALARNAKRYATGRGTLTEYTEGLAKGSVGSTFGVYLPSTFGSVLGVQAGGDPATAPRPLFMHFSGPTGVGKSLSADIIAGAVLAGDASDQNGLCGKLLLQMRAYASRSAKDIEAHTKAIRGMVAEQLFYCPRSVLIFDEIQTVAEELLDAVIGMFDGTKGGALAHHPPASSILPSAYPIAVNTSQCIVIAISDIGSTKLTADMDREEATGVVQEAADRRFMRSTKRELLQNVVPFLPLSTEELASVATMQLRAFGRTLEAEYRGVWVGKLTWGKEVPGWLAEECISDETCYADGGRGVRTKIELEVQELASDVLMPELLKTELNYNNLHIELAEGGDALTASIDTVYDDATEFREL